MYPETPVDSTTNSEALHQVSDSSVLAMSWTVRLNSVCVGLNITEDCSSAIRAPRTSTSLRKQQPTQSPCTACRSLNFGIERVDPCNFTVIATQYV